MIRLGVNLDHVATVRQARYRSGGEPDPVAAALSCEAAGCHGITAHLREDRRHIQDRDVLGIREAVGLPLNLEMANVPEMVEFASRLRPRYVCMVPERREELTTEGGLDARGLAGPLRPSVRRLQEEGVEVSLFIDPIAGQVEAAAEIGAAAVELHTGAYAEACGRGEERQAEERLEQLSLAASQAHRLGLKVNAGHGLNYRNASRMRQVPHLQELNIGHSIVSRALDCGMERAVREMLALIG